MRLLSLYVVMFLAAIPWPETSGAKILAMVGIPSKSHHIWNRSLMRALAARGHQVTVFSPDPEKTPIKNHRDIVIDGAYQNIEDVFDYETMDSLSPYEFTSIFFEWGGIACTQALESKGGKALIALTKTETFDLIIVEAALEECFLGFVPKFGSPPVVAITAFGVNIWSSYLTGNPEFPSYIPHYAVPFTNDMTFLERAHNFMVQAHALFYREWFHIPNQDELVKKYLGEGIPSIWDLERNISLILINNNFAFDFARPFVPALIPVGGMHITPSKPLPKDLKKFMDEAEHGVIFFSLGSNVRSDKLSHEKLQTMLHVFGQLPQRVVWKFESEGLTGVPDNVMLGKWMPQNDILGHPNIKLFITHSGMLSTQETVYHGVPVVGIPFLADQHVNIQKSIKHGIGVKLPYSSLTKETMLQAVLTVLNNPSYKENAVRLSKQFRDQTETPLERAVFWTEYVIRHGGAQHLHCIASKMSFVRYFLVDVIASFVLVAVVLLLTVKCALKLVLRATRGGSKDSNLAKPKRH